MMATPEWWEQNRYRPIPPNTLTTQQLQEEWDRILARNEQIQQAQQLQLQVEREYSNCINAIRGDPYEPDYTNYLTRNGLDDCFRSRCVFHRDFGRINHRVYTHIFAAPPTGRRPVELRGVPVQVRPLSEPVRSDDYEMRDGENQGASPDSTAYGPPSRADCVD